VAEALTDKRPAWSPRRAAVLGLFVLSGFAALIYEVVWLRELSLTLGKSTYSLSIILAAFMGGMAIGNLVFGRLADRLLRPLAVFGLLELAIGATGLSLLGLFAVLSPVYRSLITSLGLGIDAPIVLLIKPVVAGALLTLQTVFMGGTLPVLSRYVVRSAGRIGEGIGLLYAANTLGATAGCAVAGFLLLPGLGMRTCALVAVCINLGLGSVLLAIGRNEVRTAGGETAAESVEETPAREPVPAWFVPAWFVPAAYFLTGGMALAYEVLWTRQLLYFIGNGSYAFAVMLASVLLGIGLGSALYSRLLAARPQPLETFGAFHLLIALFVLLGLLFFYRLGYFYSLLRVITGAESWLGRTSLRAFLAFAMLIGPTVLFGAAFPLVNRLHVERVSELGRGVGLLTAVNALGGITGSFAAGFLLLPLFGINGSLGTVAVVGSMLGGVSLWRAGRGRARLVAAAAATMLVLLALFVPRFVPPPIAAGDSLRRREIIWYEEGADATLAITQSRRGNRLLDINGSVTAADTFTDVVVHKMLAHLPAIFHPAPRRALVIGLGLGVTAHSLAAYPELTRLDVIELVEDERKSASFFAHVNGNVLDDPRLRLVIGDGRDYAGTTDERYDVISFNAVHPRLGSALYTTSFYELCRARLGEGGIVAGWIPTNHMSNAELRSLFATFAASFADVGLWYVNPAHTVILGSQQPLRYDADLLTRRLAGGQVADDLRSSYLHDPASFLAFFLAGRENLLRYAGHARLSTDDDPAVEYTRVPDKAIGNGVVEPLLDVREPVQPFLAGGGDALRSRTARMFEARGHVTIAELVKWKYGDTDLAVHRVRLALDAVPDDPYVHYLAATWGAVRYDEAVSGPRPRPKPPRLEPVLQVGDLDQATALFDEGTQRLREGAVDAAIASMEAALILDPDYVAAMNNLGRAYLLTGDPEAAIDVLENAVRLEPGNWRGLSHLAAAQQAVGDASAALASLEVSVENNPYNVDALDRLAHLRQQAGDESGAAVVRERIAEVLGTRSAD
jgi:spermidine synthase